jgi:hypothetical protein
MIENENENVFDTLKKTLPNKYFLFEGKEYFCVETKMIRIINLAIFTKNDKTIVLFYKHEAEKIIFETSQEKINRKLKSPIKYSFGLSVDSTNYDDKKRLKKIVSLANNKIPLSDEMHTYLMEKYKDLPTNIDDREWSEEEDCLLFRESSRVMAILLNRSIPTINKMKKLSLKLQNNGVKINQIEKPLNKLQIDHFTDKYKSLFKTTNNRVWTSEEISLIFRGKPNIIAEMLQRNLHHVYKKRKSLVCKLERESITQNTELKKLNSNNNKK